MNKMMTYIPKKRQLLKKYFQKKYEFLTDVLKKCLLVVEGSKDHVNQDQLRMMTEPTTHEPGKLETRTGGLRNPRLRSPPSINCRPLAGLSNNGDGHQPTEPGHQSTAIGQPLVAGCMPDFGSTGARLSNRPEQQTVRLV
ncbi:hypothetical protein Droror1_Dr00016489 [Drosera rotundifolia]